MVYWVKLQPATLACFMGTSSISGCSTSIHLPDNMSGKATEDGLWPLHPYVRAISSWFLPSNGHHYSFCGHLGNILTLSFKAVTSFKENTKSVYLTEEVQDYSLKLIKH